MMRSLPIDNAFYSPFSEHDEKHMEVEYILRNYYVENPQTQLNVPHQFNNDNPFFQQLVHKFPAFQEVSKEQLGESPAIDDDLDIAIFRHIRYLPALLHTHAFFEVVFVVDGHCSNYIGNRKIFMEPGDVCIIAPHTEHTIAAFDDDCLILNFLIRSSTFDSTFMNVFSDMDIISDFFMQTLYGNHKDFYLLFHTGNDEELLNVIFKLLTDYHGFSRYRRKILNLHMSMFFMLLMQNHETDVFIPNPRNGKSDKNFIYILHYLQKHYLTISLKDLASNFNYSERQMSRILLDYTGMNFSENIQKLRMERAVYLLNNTSLSIAEIAEKSGYTNITHFRQIFKKYYEMSPVEFRNMTSK